MNPLPSQPWRKITDLPSGIGAMSDWQGFPPALLQITQEAASAIPCEKYAGCYMNVIEHAPNDIVGVCSSEIQRCVKRPLTKMEVAAYRLNHAKLFSILASAIGFVDNSQQINEAPKLWGLGKIQCNDAKDFSVYCFLGHSASQLDKACNHICLSETSPSLFIIPHGLMATPASLNAISRKNSKIIGLDDLLMVDANGGIVAKPSAHDLLNAWLEPLLPKKTAAGSLCYFPQSPGATWQSFSIRFIDGQNVHVTCSVNLSAGAAYDYSQFDLGDDRRKAEDGGNLPDMAWAYLERFANDYGKTVLLREDAQTKKKLKEKLQSFFGHANPWLKTEDPFEKVTENGKKHYKAKFNVFARSDNNA